MTVHRSSRVHRREQAHRAAIRPISYATLVVLVASLLGAGPARADEVVRTPDHASYVVDLSTGPGLRVWTGTISATFHNAGTAALSEVWFRLWGNGVAGCKPQAVMVSNPSTGTLSDPSVRCTAVEVALDAPLAPGATTTVSMDLQIHLPRYNYRFGWWRGVARLGNALPILAVNDDEGWHLDPFAIGGESFYSLVSDYQVTLAVPSDVETPATGVETTTNTTPDGLESRTYLAHDVRDFAWTAGQFELATGTTANGTAVNEWYEPSVLSRDEAEHLINQEVVTMDAFSDAFGDYPYPEVDVVISAGFEIFAGMEYPQLVLVIPNRVVIAHELAHQWWYGIVGDDEFEDPWVDEAFATWSMFFPFEHRGGWPPTSPWVGCSMFHWPNDEVRVSLGMDYFNAHPDLYWVPYYQGGCALARLAKLFGLDRFVQILRDYAASHWLGVTTTRDFQAVIEQAAAADRVDLDPQRFWARWRIGDASSSPIASAAVRHRPTDDLLHVRRGGTAR